ncbi:helicase [Streptomyces sp. NBC_01237]|nr:helicase [Streptomyces sp. NBC_01237]WRZ77153.1 helicase [Streptomyces sp. NBC_01237]WRZ78457.1 helicase [Streptomyces sp. NBC_01237]
MWLSNTKSRRDKLTPEQRQTLAGIGVDWAWGRVET